MMKRFLFLSICLIAIALPVKAQDTLSIKQQLHDKGITLRMSYNDYKHLYDPSQYARQEFDPYSPFGTAVASFFIPGLGQIINGEAGRGCWMLFGDVALVTGGLLSAGLWTTTDPSGKRVTTTGGTICACACWAGSIALTIFSIVDAVNMAKIKNLYYRDCQKLTSKYADVRLMPSLDFIPTAQGTQTAAGLTLAVRF